MPFLFSAPNGNQNRRHVFLDIIKCNIEVEKKMLVPFFPYKPLQLTSMISSAELFDIEISIYKYKY